MTAHHEMTPELQTQVERYALGSMSAAEAVAFEAHQELCDACRTATAEIVHGLEDLAELVPAAEVPADLWGRVQQRIAETEQLPAAASEAGSAADDLAGLGSPGAFSPCAVDLAAGIHYQAAGEEGWLETLVPGLRVKPVWVDAAAERVSVMARLDPGTVYPPHVHDGLEECIVLQGDLWVADKLMGPGDYQVSRAGSEHALQRTEHGCLLFLTGTKKQLEAVLA